MIKLICGSKGTGKTVKLVTTANQNFKECKGNIVFIEPDNKERFELNHNIRLIKAMDYDINDIDCFYGFLSGIISEDYDLREIYINRVYKIFEIDTQEFYTFIERLEKLGNKFNINIYLTMRINPEDLKEEFKKYIL